MDGIRTYYRKQIERIIAQDKLDITATRKTMTEDGYGGHTMEEIKVYYSGRIYNRYSAREVLGIHGVSIGWSTVAHAKILTIFEADIQEGDLFEYDGRKMRVRFVKEYMGMCKQAELEVVEDVGN